MFHYVRRADSFQVSINNFYDFDKFKSDILKLKKQGKTFLDPKTLSRKDWIQVAKDPETIILTFDDGYLDHSRLVVPFLTAQKISGLFFVPSKILTDRTALHVNKIHVLLHEYKDREIELFQSLIYFLQNELCFSVEKIQNLKETYLIPGKYDDEVTNFLKRTFQLVLSEVDLEKFSLKYLDSNSLTSRFLADNLYLNLKDFELMQSQGHVLGLHSHQHFYLSKLSREEQLADFRKSINVFRANNCTDPFTLAYPYGDYNSETLALCEQVGIKVSFIDNMHNVSIDYPYLTIPRIDCNDFF